MNFIQPDTNLPADADFNILTQGLKTAYKKPLANTFLHPLDIHSP